MEDLIKSKLKEIEERENIKILLGLKLILCDYMDLTVSM